MAEFAYRAADAQGRIASGVMQATSEEALEARLREAGLWLLACERMRENARRRARHRLTRREQLQFFAEVVPLVRAGIPLVEALEELAAHAGARAVRELALALESEVRAGGSLAEAMAAHAESFPPEIRAIVQAGEASGELAKAFAQAQAQLDWSERIATQVRQASLYPAIVLAVVGAFIALLLGFVVPRFAQVLNTLGVALPLPTRLLIGAGAFVQHFWLAGLLALIGAVLLWRALRRVPALAEGRDRLKLRLPLVGPIHHTLAAARLSRHASALLRAGVPLMDVLALLPELVGNAAFASALQRVAARVAEGTPLSEALAREPVFPSLLVRMTRLGESTGRLDEALAEAARTWEEDAALRIKRLFALAEPALTLLLVGIVGVVALALFLPLVSVMGALR